MEEAYTRQNRQRRIVLCGSGPEIRAIAEALADGGIPVQIHTNLQAAADSATRRLPAILIAEADRIAGPEAARIRLRLNLTPNLRILAIGKESSFADAAELVRTGVAGFIESTFSYELLDKVFDCVDQGELWVTRRLLAEMVSNQPAGSTSLLTRRELEILKRISSGDNNRQIAEALFVTRDTVRWHLRSAYAKLGVHDRHAASELLWLGAESMAASNNNEAMRQPA